MSENDPDVATDVTIVGAGAAGLAAAIFARRANPARSVHLLDGARKPGAKILVSGGGRCNVTNRVVSEHDFWGGRPSIVRRVLQAFTAGDAEEFFRQLAVPLSEEADGKLFPATSRARDVLNALLRCAADAGVHLTAGCRVLDVERLDSGFRVVTSAGAIRSRSLVLATGGRSLPKTGSDGAGLELARNLGHTIVPTTPALVPLVLDTAADSSIHRELSGVSHDAELAVWIDGRIRVRLRGSLLWTHFGIKRPGRVECVTPLASGRARGAPRSSHGQLLPGSLVRSTGGLVDGDRGGSSENVGTRRALEPPARRRRRQPWFGASPSIPRSNWRT